MVKGYEVFPNYKELIFEKPNFSGVIPVILLWGC